MSKLLCCDYNNLCFRMLFIKDVMINTKSPNYALWRYKVFEGIFSLVKQFSSVDEVVIAVDDKNSWRKSYFPRYKESRKKKRDKQDDIDWNNVFKEIDNFRKELKHYMPFKVLKIRSAEADDIIAVLVKYAIENTKKDCIISSNDEDYKQLCSKRVKLWNPMKREYVKCDNPEVFLITKILTGQSKDDIFNVITPSNWGQTEGTEGKRKPGFGIKSAEKVLNEGYEKWLENHLNEKKFDIEGISYKENFKRNSVLIDFNRIPKIITSRVVEEYLNYNFPPPSNMYQFFKKYNMRGFLDEFSKVENVLIKMYK